MCIGIIAAEDEEMLAIKELMKEVTKKSIFNLKFYIGKIHDKDCVLVKCGVGKVNSARTTQILIDNFDVQYVVNVGSAGGIDPDLKIGDIVIGDRLVQYDFDIRGVGDYELGEICDLGKYIESDKKLLDIIKNTKNELKDINIKFGTIASADKFFNDVEEAPRIRKEFDNSKCVEMEGAAIAQVCFLDNIPFIVIRGISDVANGNNKIDFHEYLKMASKQCAVIMEKIIKKI